MRPVSTADPEASHRGDRSWDRLNTAPGTRRNSGRSTSRCYSKHSGWGMRPARRRDRSQDRSLQYSNRSESPYSTSGRSAAYCRRHRCLCRVMLQFRCQFCLSNSSAIDNHSYRCRSADFLRHSVRTGAVHEDPFTTGSVHCIVCLSEFARAVATHVRRFRISSGRQMKGHK